MNSFRRPLTIYRKTSNPILGDNGLFTEAPAESFSVMADVQLMKPNEMKALPEGRRQYRALKVYTDEQLIMPNQITGQQADTFYWLGLKFEVVASDPYQSDVISHFRAYATEVSNH